MVGQRGGLEVCQPALDGGLQELRAIPSGSLWMAIPLLGTQPLGSTRATAGGFPVHASVLGNHTPLSGDCARPFH
jgi:hypothetical protein